MIHKDTWQIGEAKIYSEKFLPNPLVVGSYQGISELYKFITNLEDKNKKIIDGIFKLKELIEFEYGDCNCDSEKKCSYCKIMEKIKEVENEART
jgi:hypothetical protein